MTLIDKLNVKIFADGADKAGMLEMYAKPFIKGFTTNPTLMRKAGIADYKAFAREILQAIPDRPISFEVFSDEFPEMERQALEIANWERMSMSRFQSQIPLDSQLTIWLASWPNRK